MKKIILFLTILIISANIVSAALIAHYSFDEGDRDIVGDLAGTNTGTLYGNTKLLMSFDNQNAVDESGYGNDGKHYGNTRLLMSFDDGTATDLSDYGNDGNIVGATYTADGKSGGAYNFTGEYNSHISIPDTDVTLNFTVENFTIMGWARFNDETPTKGSLISKGNWNQANQSYGLVFYSNSVRFFGNGNWATAATTSWTPYFDNGWHFYVGVRDGANDILYIDGQLKNNKTVGYTVLAPTTAHVDIGKLASENNYYLNGSIDEVAIYSKALPSDEISDIYNANKAKFTDWTTETKSGDGSALEFDGFDDYVDISKDVSDLSDYTIEAWVYFSSDNTQTFPGIVSMRTGNENDYSAGISFQFYNGGGYYLDAEGAAISVRLPKVSENTVGEGISYDTWHHVALTVDRDGGTGGVIQYVDGIQSTTGTAVDNPTHRDDILIGARYYTNCDNPDNICDYFNGKIDEVAIYSKVLSPDEINQHYLDKKAKFTDWTTDTPPGLGGYALEFDGVDDYVTFNSFPETNEITVSFWVNREEEQGFYGGRLIDRNSNQGLIIRPGGYVYAYNGSSLIGLGTILAIPSEVWTHYTLTIEGEDVITYLNGEPDGSASMGGVYGDIGGLTIGRRHGINDEYFNGKIDEVKIYNEALTQEQVQNEFSRGNAYWRPLQQPERFGAPGFVPNLITVLIIMSALTLLSLHNIRKK